MKYLIITVFLAAAQPITFGQATRLPEVVVTGARVIGPDHATVTNFLARPILDKGTALAEVQRFAEKRIPQVRLSDSRDDWRAAADELRRNTLKQVVFRGEARQWREGSVKVEWLDTIPGGPGYHIKKLRYEAVPGLWIPALLYEPDDLRGKVPVVLNVNGHDGKGKAADYKQMRCINMAKRGMIALNVEWLGMGQLRTPGNKHGSMNQLDLCGTSGIAPFYLAMSRALDVLLEHPQADPNRVAVAGLSGGGWQTIFISSLDTRVTLANPVAGYSSFRTRARFFEDLGDSEQTPSDLATVVDYADLTAMMAPRPLLLTFNVRDNCCFRADHAMQPLWDAATPAYKLFGVPGNIENHQNFVPGDHNFGQDNREALYRMLGKHFFPADPSYPNAEIPCPGEIKTTNQLYVPLPAKNATLNSIAAELAQSLPRFEPLPDDPAATAKRRDKERLRLRKIVRASDLAIDAKNTGIAEQNGIWSSFWQLNLGGEWTVPVVELAWGVPSTTAIFVADQGRAKSAAEIERLLLAGNRVVAFDPFYFGESKIPTHDWLFAILTAATGERPLGIQASQIAAVARWAAAQFRQGPVALVSDGPRTGASALVAAAIETEAIRYLDRKGAMASLKPLIEKNTTVDANPELFCFGLLKHFDFSQIEQLISPRPVGSR